jgi:hypothetical protein
VLLQTTKAQNSIVDLKKSTSEKFEELTAMHNILGKRLDTLSVALGAMVKVAVSNAVREACTDLEETRKYATLDSPRSVLEDQAYSAYRQQRWSTTSGHQRLGTNTRAARQICYERTVCLWFATITLQSRSTVAQEMLPPDQDNERQLHETTSTRIRVNIRLPPWILRKGVLAFLKRQYLGGTPLSSDMRLRVYSVVSFSSPIAEACRSGDLATAYSLFQSGRASMFDIVEEFGESLFDYTWRGLKETMLARNDATHVELRVLDGLIETFKFFTTHGLDPGEAAQQYEGEYQMSRLQEVLEHAISTADFLTPYIIEIIRIIITKSQQDPFESQSRYQGPLIKLACEMRPELAVYIQSQEQWYLHGCFEEDQSLPIEASKIPGVSCTGGPYFAFCLYSLVRDSDAIYLRAILRFKVTPYDLASICQHALRNSRCLTGNSGGRWDHAVKARIVACLEMGMDWTDDVSLGNVNNDLVTLVEFFASQGSLNILVDVWLELGNDLESFYANFEGEIVCAIIRNLDALRPARRWRQATVGCGREVYELSRGIFLDEAYRKFFPDDEEEIEEIGYGFDPVTFSRRMWSYIEDDLKSNADGCAEFGSDTEATESLPVVNGLTEEFWD